MNNIRILTCILRYLNHLKVLGSKILMHNVLYNDKLHGEILAMSDECAEVLRACFRHFPLCSQTNILCTKAVFDM